MKNETTIEISAQNISSTATFADAQSVSFHLNKMGWKTIAVESNGKPWQFEDQDQCDEFSADIEQICHNNY